MANNFGYYPQQNQQMGSYQNPRMTMSYMDQAQPQLTIKGRPVSSIEEAKASVIDFDGSVFYFPDLANKRIYTKQINMDGTSSFNVYEWKNDPVVSSPDYVTRQEFDSLKQEFGSVLAQLQNFIQQQTQVAEEKPAKLDF